MPSLPPFNNDGHWFKGNLHTHTTQSDGKKTPEENVTWHHENGYDFVSLTDHNRLTLYESQDDCLVIPGVEITTERKSTGVQYHIVGIGIREMPIQHLQDPQDTIDAINSSGGLCFLAHPYWHDHTIDDLLPLHGHVGIEIYNTSCWVEIQKGHSLVHWDGLLRRGPKIFGLATDDSHWNNYPDFGCGWINVMTSELREDSILSAIRQGHFYASTGPEIYDISVDNGYITVKCSPARSIYVLGQYYYCPIGKNAWDGKHDGKPLADTLSHLDQYQPITEATVKLDDRQDYLRVEVVDFYGRSAWSNPYYINEISG